MVESDEEQLEVLKNWWKENGQSIVIAVVLGFYNGNEFIDAQIRSILEQSFKNIDIFIFDDN